MTTVTTQIDQQKMEAFAERILAEVNNAMSTFNMYVGHKLGLYKTLAETGPVTSEELARKTGYVERYLKEWLSAQTAGGYVGYNAATRRFSLRPEHAAALVDQDSPVYMAPFVLFGPSTSATLPALIQAFRKGGGVSFQSYGQDCIEGIAYGNRPMYLHDLVEKWIPAMPDVHTRLQNGGRVADIGCGVGWSTISLARGYPNAQVDGIDVDAASIEQARATAEKEGVSDRVTFHNTPAEKARLEGPYDLVTAFECLHDMPYPVEALGKMRELAGPGRTVLIADEAAGDTLEENCNFLGHFFYNVSVLHCLPQAMVFPDAGGTGTAIGPATVRRYAEQAGFTRVEVLDIENLFFRFYRLTP
jgi:ubiquinone/menaquinone biosynthesis C-methylase UbiE